MNRNNWRRLIVDPDTIDPEKFIRFTLSVAVPQGRDINLVATQILQILTLRSQRRQANSQPPIPDGTGAVTHVGQQAPWTEVILALPASQYAPSEGLGHLLQLLASPVEYSYADGIWAQRIDLPQSYMTALPGPRFGVAGLRQLFGVPDRPLLALEVGPRSEEITNDLLSAYQTALVAGVDVLVDDMLMGNPPGPWHQTLRVPALTRICERASQQTGKRKAYFTTLAGTPRTIQANAYWAQQNNVGGFVLNAFTQGFGVLEDLAQSGTGCAIITTNMGSGTASRPPTDRSNLTLSQRVGIDEQVFAKLSRLAGADAVHCGTTGSECVDIPWGNAIRALSQPLRLAQRSIPSSFRVAEGDLQHKDVWPNIRELGADTLFEVTTAIMGDRQKVRKRTERFVSLLEELHEATSDDEAYSVYRDAARNDTYMQDQLNLIDRDNW